METMKKFLIMITAVLLVAACATPEERAARQAENLKVVKASVGSQKYKISVSQMTPMRGTSVYVSNRYLKIEGDQIDCSLPYAGKEDIPHLKTRGEMRMDSKIEFRGTIENYLLQLLPKKKSGVVTFTTKYSGEELKFSITIDNYGKAKIRVTPESRDYIDYEGSVYAL
jgi:hypothetical protein